MSESEHHTLWSEIAENFEALATKIEHAIEAFADDESAAIHIAALNRAKDLAQRGANVARSEKADVRRAFD